MQTRKVSQCGNEAGSATIDLPACPGDGKISQRDAADEQTYWKADPSIGQVVVQCVPIRIQDQKGDDRKERSREERRETGCGPHKQAGKPAKVADGHTQRYFHVQEQRSDQSGCGDPGSLEVEYCLMAESVPTSLISPDQVAREAVPRRSANGLSFASFGDTRIEARDLERLVQAVPEGIAHALHQSVYFFVPLAISRARTGSTGSSAEDDETLVAPVYTSELSEQATCHRNVMLGETDAVFISARLLSDRFALSFEFFINVGHGFVDATGVPAAFSELAWKQAEADVRGETSQDAWEHRGRSRQSLPGGQIDEKAKSAFFEAAFADAVAIYLLSLAVDFDYAELREREYPLLAPQALAERLRVVAGLFPPNAGYDFAIRYRRRS